MNTLNIQHDMKDILIVKKLLDYFLIVDYSQTYFYTGNVSSLKYILQEKTDKDISEVINEIKDSLERLYKTYFPKVEISVTPVEEPDSSVYSIGINIIVTNDKGIVTELSDDIELNNPYNSKHLYELKKIKNIV